MKKKKVEVSEGANPMNVMGSLLKNNKDDHLNFEDSVKYKFSTGSVYLDLKTGGGLGPGIIRYCGPSESGKTSAAVESMRKFLDKFKNDNGYAVYFKSEGRLSEDVVNRSGVKFVDKAEEWEAGTCFVMESNVIEFVFDSIKTLIKEMEGCKIYFLIDSADGLSARTELEKKAGETPKIGIEALMMAINLRKVSSTLTKRGHVLSIISQVRSKIAVDKYDTTQKSSNSQVTSSGGNALTHYAEWSFQFLKPIKGDWILENPKLKFDSKTNRKIGHTARIEIAKSTNEITGDLIEYPILYKRKGGSVWKDKEIFDLMLGCGFITRSGKTAWYEFDKSILDDAKINSEKLQFQGESKAIEFISEFTKEQVESIINKIAILIESE